MARYPKITLAPHLSAEELKERYRACDNPKEARRWHALWLFSAGKSIGEVSELVGFHRNWVRTFLKRYNEQGPDAVADQHQLHPGGREPYLTPEQQQELEQAIARPAPDGGLWTGPNVSAWIAERTGRRIYPQLGWAYLQKLGFVRREPRPPTSGRRFGSGAGSMEKKLSAAVAAVQAAQPTATVEVWRQDEGRIGLKPMVRRVWVKRGSRPRAVNHHRYEWLYAYSFVHPVSGRNWWLILPTVRTDVMSLALREFAQAHGVGAEKQVVLVLDGAGWHTSGKLDVPEGA
jgi:transposase